MTYKRTNGRIQHRTGGGQFRRTTLQDFGFKRSEVASGAYVCNECGYGGDGQWFPVLVSGYCPQCKSKDKHEFGEGDKAQGYGTIATSNMTYIGRFGDDGRVLVMVGANSKLAPDTIAQIVRDGGRVELITQEQWLSEVRHEPNLMRPHRLDAPKQAELL